MTSGSLLDNNEKTDIGGFNEGMRMKKHIADIITAVRILGSILMVFVPAFSALFYVLYVICGLSDMADGTVARKTDSASQFGAVFDTVADFLFAAVAFAKLLPQIQLPGWLWIWIIAIAFIKAVNIGLGLIRRKRLISVHSVMNKVTGLLLFLFLLTLEFIELKYTAVIVCFAATIAAVQEGYYILSGRKVPDGGNI